MRGPKPYTGPTGPVRQLRPEYQAMVDIGMLFWNLDRQQANQLNQQKRGQPVAAEPVPLTPAQEARNRFRVVSNQD